MGRFAAVKELLLVLTAASIGQGIALGLAVSHRADIPETLVFALISGMFCTALSCCLYPKESMIASLEVVFNERKR